MPARRILVGLDTSEAARGALRFARGLADVMAAQVEPVHAVRDLWGAVRRASLAVVATASAVPPPRFDELLGELGERGRADFLEAFGADLDDDLRAALVVRVGSPHDVLAELANGEGVEAIVLGGKEHPTLGRWLGGGTAAHLIREVRAPVMVTREPARVERVLVAVDLAESARQTLVLAERLAAGFQARLRAIHVVVNLPHDAEQRLGMSQAGFRSVSREILEESIWGGLEEGVERVLLDGDPVTAIEEEVRAYGADLLVVGAVSVPPVTSRLLGSTTERLLNDLPTSLVVVPVGVT